MMRAPSLHTLSVAQEFLPLCDGNGRAAARGALPHLCARPACKLSRAIRARQLPGQTLDKRARSGPQGPQSFVSFALPPLFHAHKQSMEFRAWRAEKVSIRSSVS